MSSGLQIRSTDGMGKRHAWQSRMNKGIDGAWDVRKDDDTATAHRLRKHQPATPPAPKPTCPPVLTGGKSDHYQVQMMVHCGDGKPDIEVQFDCNDLIEELNMTFAEGEVFKAVWRKAAARLGKGKPGHQPLYDAQKIEFFGKRMVTIHSKKA